MNKEHNYAYEAGYLKGLIMSFKYGGIPGIKVTDEKLFEKFVKEKVLHAETRGSDLIDSSDPRLA